MQNSESRIKKQKVRSKKQESRRSEGYAFAGNCAGAQFFAIVKWVVSVGFYWGWENFFGEF